METLMTQWFHKISLGRAYSANTTNSIVWCVPRSAGLPPPLVHPHVPRSQQLYDEAPSYECLIAAVSLPLSTKGARPTIAHEGLLAQLAL